MPGTSSTSMGMVGWLDGVEGFCVVVVPSGKLSPSEFGRLRLLGDMHHVVEMILPFEGALEAPPVAEDLTEAAFEELGRRTGGGERIFGPEVGRRSNEGLHRAADLVRLSRVCPILEGSSSRSGYSAAGCSSAIGSDDGLGRVQ